MNGFLLLSAALFATAAVLAFAVNHDVIVALILGGVSSYVAAGAGVRVAHG